MRSIATASITILCSGLVASAAAEQSYESYYRYLGEHPDNWVGGWTQDVQGVTHDDEYWYITQTGALWKIHVTRNLGSVYTIEPPMVTRLALADAGLPSGYDHFGDPSWRSVEGTGYLVVPVTGGSLPRAIAFFRAADLSYVAHAAVPDLSDGVGWCAVDENGLLYISEGHPSSLHVYQLDWESLGEVAPSISLSPLGTVPLLDEFGAVLSLRHAQGGVFSPSGDLFFLNTGYMVGFWCDGDTEVDEDWMRENGGIHVFDTSSWLRVQKSVQGGSFFHYEFHPGGMTCEEPEGLTIWDFDAPGSPNPPYIHGQLHVLMLDNELGSDDAYFKHYTHTLHVAVGASGDGTPTSPFGSVGEARDLAWDGSQIMIGAGSYPEQLVLSTRVKLIANGAPAIIGE